MLKQIIDEKNLVIEPIKSAYLGADSFLPTPAPILHPSEFLENIPPCTLFKINIAHSLRIPGHPQASLRKFTRIHNISYHIFFVSYATTRISGGKYRSNNYTVTTVLPCCALTGIVLAYHSSIQFSPFFNKWALCQNATEFITRVFSILFIRKLLTNLPLTI